MSTRATPAVRWLERGEGEAVVLLHGLMGSMDHWDTTLDVLGAGYRALAPLLPIFDPTLEDASIAALARHVLRLLDALEIERAIVGGSSLGGHVALDLALRWPDRVSGVVLTGSSGLPERGLARHVPHAPSLAWVRTRMRETFHDPSIVTPGWVLGVHKLLNTRATAARVLRFARATRRSSVEADLPRMTVPTLLVWGWQDRITPRAVAERFHALIPPSELVYLPDCGHAPMLEQPALFAEIVRDWLRETCARRAAMLAGGGK